MGADTFGFDHANRLTSATVAGSTCGFGIATDLAADAAMAKLSGRGYAAWTTPSTKGAVAAGTSSLAVAPDTRNGGLVVASRTAANQWRVERKHAANDADSADVQLSAAVVLGEQVGLASDRGDLYAAYRASQGQLAVKRHAPERGWDTAELVLDPSGGKSHPAVRGGADGGPVDLAWTRATGASSEVRAQRLAVRRPAISGLVANPTRFSPAAGQSTTISYTLADDSASTLAVTVGVYDTSNTLVRTLVNGASQPTGPRSTVWDGKDASGVVVRGGEYTCG